MAFDENLENLRAFIREFSVLGIDVIYEKHIHEYIDSAQTMAPSLPPIIKSAAKLLVEIGDKATKPLFKKFATQKAQTIDPALQKIFGILLKPDQEVLKEKLSKHLHETLEKVVFEHSLSAPDYINPILNRFSVSEKPTLTDLFPQKRNFNPKLIKQTLKKLLNFGMINLNLNKSIFIIF